MNRHQSVDDRALADSRVVWPTGGEALHNTRQIAVAVLAATLIITLLCVIFALGELHLFG